MAADIVIVSARLAAPASAMTALHHFYVDCLGFRPTAASETELSLPAGPGILRFAATSGAGSPFHHFALLVPGDRFAAASSWARRCARLLSRPGEPSTTFHFRAWDATACYLHDPAGNILELIAHRGRAEAGRGPTPFAAAEIAGISEVGLVVDDPPAAAGTLTAAGLRHWSGTVEGDDALAFVGRQAHTLILCRPGRPWLPTQRPAEAHAATVTLAAPGGDPVAVAVADGELSVTVAGPAGRLPVDEGGAAG